MHTDLLSALARIRVHDLLRDAAHRRALRAGRPPVRPFRRELARAIRAMGNAALTLGDVIAESR